MRLRFLGTSDSAGMPVHNCMCTGCMEYRQNGRKNYPTSAIIEGEDGVIMLDAGYDEACWHLDGRVIHGIFLTHFHADHVYGLLRLRFSEETIPVFHPYDEKGFAKLYEQPHRLRFTCNTPFIPLHVNGITLTPIPLKHSKNTTGYLIETAEKRVAYLTDCAGIPKESMAFLQLKPLDAVFIDACYAPDFVGGNHLNFEQAGVFIKALGAKEGFLMHECHQTASYVLENKPMLPYPYIPEGFSYRL